MTNTSTPIEFFKKEAKKLFRQVQANDAEAIARVQRVLKDPQDVSLMRIQHVVAVEYGFSKWEDLIKTPGAELQTAISNEKSTVQHSNGELKKTGTQLGNLYRGPSEVIPTAPHYAAMADMFDKMTLQEQERYLDEDARAMGFFKR
jgi:hypothetical protein